MDSAPYGIASGWCCRCVQRAEGTNDELATGLAVGAGEAEMALPTGSEEEFGFN